MVSKLKNALDIGFESFDQRTKNNNDIKKLIEMVNKTILEVSNNAVGFKINKDVSMQMALLSLVGAGADLKESKSENIPYTALVYSTQNPKREIGLTKFELHINGFPCSIIVSGNKLVAHDIETLEDYFASLLSSANTVEAIKTLISEPNSSN